MVCSISSHMNSLERFLAACRREKVDRPPVWLMRQAGRYLPEYRLMRAGHDFIEICKTPELACEVSLQPWERYKMDAVIVFSDILFVPEAMGMKLTFKKDRGPHLSPVINNVSDLKILKDVDASKAFDFFYKTVRLLKKKLPADVPVIGFSGAPWTLGYYMTADRLGEWIGRNDDALHELLGKITGVVTDYVRCQQEAGVDAVQLFDTWAGMLSADHFRTFAAPYMKKIIEDVKMNAPFIVYSRRCRHILRDLAGLGAEVVSIDPETPMEEAIREIGDKVAIQGNLDPKILTTTEGFVRQETSRLLSKIKGRSGHIINLGHGVLPASHPECVASFVETVRSSA